jgi:hypothetical protein
VYEPPQTPPAAPLQVIAKEGEKRLFRKKARKRIKISLRKESFTILE